MLFRSGTTASYSASIRTITYVSVSVTAFVRELIRTAAQIPLTFMPTFYAGAEIRWSMYSTEWSDLEGFESLLDAFEQTYRDRPRGSQIADFVASATHEQHGSPNDRFADFDNLEEARLDQTTYHTFLQLVCYVHALHDIFMGYHSDLTDDCSHLSPNVRYVPRLEEGRVFYRARA